MEGIREEENSNGCKLPDTLSQTILLQNKIQKTETDEHPS
jgi:hypothetical protein